MNIKLNNLIMPNIKYGLQFEKKPNFSYPDLAPLKTDTVSFSGRKELTPESMKYAPSEKNCYQAATNAEPAKFYLSKVLDKYLEPLCNTTNNKKSDSTPFFRYSTRIKSPASIREKVTSKYAKTINDNQKEFSMQLADMITTSFNLDTAVTRENLTHEIENLIYYSDYFATGAEYNNICGCTTEIIDDLETLNVISLSGYTLDEKAKNYFKIRENLLKNSKTKERNSNNYDPASIRGIKHYANDIVGARIVLEDLDGDNMYKLMEALKKAVNDGALKITSIEDILPNPDKLPEGKKLSDYEYASVYQLKSLAKAANAPLIINHSKTGYMGIHLNLDLSNPIFSAYNNVFNGYQGEIQIIGTNVEKLKDVEDICYKLKDKKNSINPAYKLFRDYFLKYYNDETKKDFDDYTYYLYLAQRSLPGGSKRTNKFPTIKELGFEEKVPQELDFNTLRKFKQSCDMQAKILNAKEEISKKHVPDIKKQGDIRTMKNIISDKLK